MTWSAETALVALALAASAAVQGAEGSACDGFVFERSELPFVHRSGASPEKHLPETMGSGLAWIDWDGDGWLDLYLVQSGRFPGRGDEAAANRLLRNVGGELVPWTGEAASPARDRGYGQGALAVDLEGDGDLDLVVTQVGPTILLVNDGRGGFERRALDDSSRPRPWGSSAAAADGDGDGDLDLYVTHYLDYDPEAEIFCGDVEQNVREYCDPSLFEGLRDTYWRNLGAASFEDATEAAGLAAARAKGLGVLFVDLDGDRRPDLYVANDLDPNLLYRNLGNGSFEDLSLLSGSAVDGNGKPEAGMGLTVADFDGDGDPDLAVTNFDVETNTLYRNLGANFFEDSSAASGFGQPSFNLLGFGLLSEDLDLDGRLDVYVANGHIFESPKRENVAYRQPDLLLAGQPGGRFSRVACDVLDGHPSVARGAAAADLDNDGDTDVAVSNSDAAAVLLRNGVLVPGAQRGAPAWLGVELVGMAPNTEAIGAVVTLHFKERLDRRWVVAGHSYQSSSDRRLRFAVPEGAAALAELRLEVTWPSGRHQRFGVSRLGHYLRLYEEAR